jgi:ankyrin repeat protein
MRARFLTVLLLLLTVALVTGGAAADKSAVADAAQQHDLAAVRTLIAGKADVNAAQIDGATALHWAVYHQDAELVDQLLRAGALPDQPNREGITPTQMAAIYGDAPILSRLLKAGADPKQLGANGETLVMYAARNGNPEALALLIEAGIDVNAAEHLRQTTALMWAAEQGHTEAVQLLAKAGANTSAKSGPAGLPRNYLAPRVNVRAVEEAQKRRERAAAAGRTYEEQLDYEYEHNIDLGAPRNAFTPDRATARAGGAAGGNRNGRDGGAAPAAPEAPANSNAPATATAPDAGKAPATSGASSAKAAAAAPAAAAPAAGAAGTAKPAASSDAAKDADAPDAKDTDDVPVVAGLVGSGGGGLTPLVFAAREGHTETVKALLDAGAPINETTEYGWTPLLTAVNNRHFKLASMLIERGADVNIANKGGWTPLYIATDNRNIEGGDYPVAKPDMDSLEFIKLLLDKGANVNAKVKDNTLTRTIFTMQWFQENGATAFVRAAQSSDTALMKLLLDYGADPQARTAMGDNALTAAGGVGWVDGVTYERSAKENLEAVRMLLDLGLDPNSQNNEGRTALMGAALKGRPEVVQLLADRGATLDLHDRGSRDTHIPGATIAGLTFIALDYAEGLVRVGVQSAVERPEAAKLIRKLMAEQGLQVPPEKRTLQSICVTPSLCGQAAK